MVISLAALRTGRMSSAYSGVCGVIAVGTATVMFSSTTFAEDAREQVEHRYRRGKALRIDIIERRDLRGAVGQHRTVGAHILLDLVERHGGASGKGARSGRESVFSATSDSTSEP